jgi:hypothetical protein
VFETTTLRLDDGGDVGGVEMQILSDVAPPADSDLDNAEKGTLLGAEESLNEPTATAEVVSPSELVRTTQAGTRTGTG